MSFSSLLETFLGSGNVADLPTPATIAATIPPGWVGLWLAKDTSTLYGITNGDSAWTSLSGGSAAALSVSTAISTVDSNQSTSLSSTLSKVTSLSTAVSTVDSNQSTSLSQVSSSLSGAISSTSSLSTAVSSVISGSISTDVSLINSLSTAVGSGSAFSGATVKKSADQTGVTFSASVPLVWDSEVVDTGGWHHFTSTVTITIASPGIVTWNAHGFSNGNAISITTTGALPTGLTAGTVYYVVNAAANTFQLATTVGGTAINTSGSQSGTHTATNDSVLRVPANVAEVSFGANLRLANMTSSTSINFLLVKNGTSIFDGTSGYSGFPGTAAPRLSVISANVPVSAGDNLEVLLSVGTGTADVTASVSNFWVRAVG